MIKKATIAVFAEVVLIDLAFSEDVNPYHAARTKAMAGLREWAGIIQKAPFLHYEVAPLICPSS